MIWTKKEIEKIRSIRLSMYVDERMEDTKAKEYIDYEIRRQFKQELPDFNIDPRDVKIVVDTSSKAYMGNTHVAYWQPDCNIAELLGGVGHEKVVQVPYQGAPVHMKALNGLDSILFEANRRTDDIDPFINTREIVYELYGWSTSRKWIYTERA